MTNNLRQRITLFLNPVLAKHAKAHAILSEMSLTNLVEAALIAYLPKEIIIKKSDIAVGKKDKSSIRTM